MTHWMVPQQPAESHEYSQATYSTDQEMKNLDQSRLTMQLTLSFQHQFWTRTTRTPAIWGYPQPPHDYPYHWVILDPKSKEDKVKVTNLFYKKFAQISNFWILKRALPATHLLKLVDKMCKYEMDPMSIVEDTERARFCPQTDRRTDGQTDRRTDTQTDGQGDTSTPPFQLRWSRGYNDIIP